MKYLIILLLLVGCRDEYEHRRLSPQEFYEQQEAIYKPIVEINQEVVNQICKQKIDNLKEAVNTHPVSYGFITSAKIYKKDPELESKIRRRTRERVEEVLQKYSSEISAKAMKNIKDAL